MLYENLKAIAEERKLSLYKVERDLSFGNGTIQKWKNVSPSIEKVKLVADYLDVSLDLLLNREKYIHSKTASDLAFIFDSLPPDKQNLIQCYFGVVKVN